MPRASQASLTVLRPAVDGKASRLDPPSDLSAKERKLFTTIVSASTVEHLRASDLPLLCEYVRVVIGAEQAAAKVVETGGPVIISGPDGVGQTNPWFLVRERLAKRMMTLAMRLRLCPSARTRPEVVARRAGYGSGPSAYDLRPWEQDDAG
jgi:phage terminase small subunit